MLLIDEEIFKLLEQDPDDNTKIKQTNPQSQSVKELEAKLLGLLQSTCDRFSGEKDAELSVLNLLPARLRYL